MTNLRDIPKAPYYLKVRKGRYKTSYWLWYRANGLDLRQTIEGDFADWRDALKAADKIIAEARFGKKPTPKELVRSEDIIQQLLTESETSDDPATRQIKANIFGKHLRPWVNESAPYASQFTVATWPAYKAFKRSERSTIALENHYKYFAMLARRIWELGIIPNKIRIKFSVKKEDFRRPGNRIPDDHYRLIVAAATPENFRVVKSVQPKWRDRIILQRRTGLRPGEARELEKDRVKVKGVYAIVDIPPEKSKTDIGRKFRVKDPDVLEVFQRRLEMVPGPYFFPSETDPNRPMDKHLNGWHSILRRAFDPERKGLLIPEYTPHDLRHTYASEMFQKTDKYVQLCYQLNMSLEIAQEVYIHLDEEDTADLAELAAGIGAEKGAP